ncbi:hypothetical protein MTO96_039618 [Rhipicephalus appendiculatus]
MRYFGGVAVLTEKRPSDASSRGGEGCSVQCRYVLIVLGFLGLANVYGMRVNLNVALVAMVNHTAVQETTKPSDCPLPTTHLHGAPQTPANATGHGTKSGQQDGPFVWDPVTQGVILGRLLLRLHCDAHPRWQAGRAVRGQVAVRTGHAVHRAAVAAHPGGGTRWRLIPDRRQGAPGHRRGRHISGH